jgi:glycosyltransferase involved in cell wall biosynthesis
MINSVIVYNKRFGSSIGGTESYAAAIIKLLDRLESKPDVFLMPARNLQKYDVNRYLESYYDIKLSRTLRPARFFTKGLFINCSWNEFINAHKYGIHIIHFSTNLKVRLRKNPYKILLNIFQKLLYHKSYSYYVCNSCFTEKHFKLNWPHTPPERIKVVYPPVKLFRCNADAVRKHQIVTFSRFDPEKKLDVLLQTFIVNFKDSDIHLIFMGSVSEKGNPEYLQKLKNLACANIDFVVNPSREKANKVFDESMVFWHAKGFGETEPGLFEHFGISTVEAMSAGVIPVVINKGGQCEIVDHGVSGYKWDTTDELTQYTKQVFSITNEARRRMAAEAVKKSCVFGAEAFEGAFKKILSEFVEA